MMEITAHSLVPKHQMHLDPKLQQSQGQGHQDRSERSGTRIGIVFNEKYRKHLPSDLPWMPG